MRPTEGPFRGGSFHGSRANITLAVSSDAQPRVRFHPRARTFKMFELAEGPHDNGTHAGAQVIYALGAAGTAST